MATPRRNVGSSFTLSLSADDSTTENAPFIERVIVLDGDKPTVRIGRASKVRSKGFVAEPDNGWFDSPVMSREHAEITADLDSLSVHIKDVGSLHGTYVNDDNTRLDPNHLRTLDNGDCIRFGVPIWRGSESFAPTTVKVGIVLHESNGAAMTTTFSVPDHSDISDQSDLDDELSDDGKENEGPIVRKSFLGALSSDPIDLTMHEDESDLSSDDQDVIEIGAVTRQTDRGEVIVIEPSPSVPQADVSAPANSVDAGPSGAVMSNNTAAAESPRVASPGFDYVSGPFITEAPDPALSLGRESAGEITAFMCKDFDDEPDSDYGSSIHMSTDMDDESNDEESMASDIDDFNSEDEDEDEEEALEMEWEGEYSSDEDVEEGPGEGFLLWDDDDLSEASGEEDLPTFPPMLAPSFPELAVPVTDNTGSTDTGARTCENSSVVNCQPVRIEGLLNDVPQPSTAALPAFAAAHFLTLSRANTSVRQPSPSDAAMPKRFAERATKNTLEVLGDKTGKYDYFAAREENKLAVSKMASPSACQDQPRLPQCSLGAILTTEAPPLPPQPLWIPTGNGIVKHFSIPASLGHEERLSEVDNMASVSVFNKAQGISEVEHNCRRTIGISDIVDACQPSTENRRKRKADDISNVAPKDLEWDASQSLNAKRRSMSPPVQVSSARESLEAAAPSPESISLSGSVDSHTSQIFSPEIPSVPQLTTEPAASSQDGIGENIVTPTNGRPTKRLRLRRIAERVGYAALGGVTVGAMVVGSLIYTAPSFA